jgi:membrane associated rhomboid family serine protease
MGNNGLNGSGNGEDKEVSNVTRFPTEDERRDMERIRAANEAAQRRAAREPIFNLPPVTKFVCFVLILVQAVMTALEYTLPELRADIFNSMAFIPARYTGGLELGWQGIVSPVTHMLFHGGWLHLGMNVATLAAFGAGLEKQDGGRKLMLLFVVTGIAGACAHFALFPTATNPLIGASGGISGLFGGILMMAHQRGMMEGGKKMLIAFVAIWVGISLFFGMFGMPGAEGEIAWTTHIGGFIAGLLLYKPVSKLKI